MDRSIERNRRFLTDLFAGPFRGHAIIATAERASATEGLGDFALSDRPVRDWLSWLEANYENQVKRHEALDDDSVPYVVLNTNTGIFAGAFGCEIHVYGDSPAAARPLLATAEEADRLEAPDPLTAPRISRVFELDALARERFGPEVPISVPDIQSPFDVAALIWNKEDFFVALYENPEAVARLVDKCHALLKTFLREFKAQVPGCSLCHCPIAWAPPELGCWLSEDEAGSISPKMFETFCLPSLTDLSETFGGLFMHCCATADYQYDNFMKIPNLRGLNRVFQEPGPRPAIETFSKTTVIMQAWMEEDGLNEMLDMALPETRYLFNLNAGPLDEVKGFYERLRERCPRS